jgi:transposase-like protein
MKGKEREEAIRLRKEDGISVGEIARRVGVSKGTASRWLRSVELTEEQKQILADRGMNGSSIGQQKCAILKKTQAMEKRQQYQNIGREKIRNGIEVEYQLFCSLYWAEGNKSRDTAGMTNTDVAMLKFFVDGMKKHFGCKDEDFMIRVMAHLNNGIGVEQIHSYWLKELGLPESCLRKFTLKSKYYPEQNKKHKRHVYGGCSVSVCSVEIIQKIYGSIQEIYTIDRPEWLIG